METFPDFLQRKFEEWEKTKGGRRQPVTEYARYLGVSQPSLTRWMIGDNLPTGDNIRLLADKLGSEVYVVLGIIPPLPVREYGRALRGAGDTQRSHRRARAYRHKDDA